MPFLGRTWKYGATLDGIVAHRDHMVEIDAEVFIHIIRRIARNINAIFGHDGDSPWIQPVRFNACAINSGAIAREMLEVAVGDLAAAAVAGAQDEDIH